MGLAGVEQDALGRGRFTGVNVSDDADIPIPFQRVSARHRNLLLKFKAANYRR
jgi:hypothetical protein